MAIQYDSPTLTIDRNAPAPLYSQLKEVLLTLIQEGVFQTGSPIPTERELEERFQVSRITVRRAIDELAREGYLTTQQGKGTFVAQTKIQRPLTRMKSFSSATAAEGHQPGSQLLSLRHERAGQRIAPLLKITEGDWIWVVERLRLADNEPIGISLVYLNLPPDISLTPLELQQEMSLWSLLEKKDIILTHAEETIQAVAANQEQAELLKVEVGFSLLFVEGTVFTNHQIPVEYHRIFNRGDRYKYTVHAVR